jgi:hypothetical protein
MIQTMRPPSLLQSLVERPLPAWAQYLFVPRRRTEDCNVVQRNPVGMLDILVFVFYAAVLAFAIHHHVDSDDESQAWVLARDNPLSALLLRRLHYEGAPALWPCILWIATRLHIPFSGMNWIGAGFALSGIAVLLRFAPFPRIFRWLLPFTFFLQFQYAAIARPYTLFPLLLFAICILYPLQRPRPILFAVAAGLMANLSFHAAVIAGLFALLYMRHLYEADRNKIRQAPTPRQRATAIGVFSFLALLAAFTAFPPADGAFPPKDAASVAKAESRPPTLWKRVVSAVLPPERLPAGAPPLDPIVSSGSAKIASTPPPSPVLFLIARTILIGTDTALYPIAKSNLLGIVFLCGFLLWLQSRHRPELFLPFFLSIIISSQVFVYDHHSGQFLLTILAAAWIALELPTESSTSGHGRPLLSGPSATRLFASVALSVVLLQIAWSVHSIEAQARQPYDPGHETADFLMQNFAGKRVAGFSYETVSSQPYASHSLFFNQPAAYWIWSSSIFIDARRTEVLRQHPDAIVLAEEAPGPEFFFAQFQPVPVTPKREPSPILTFFQKNGFRETHRFCGYRFIRLSYSAVSCEVILEPDHVVPNSTHQPPAYRASQ